MPTKWGKINTFGRTGAKFVEAYLETGERVELPHEVLRYITERYSRDTSLVFVERRGRLFHYVHWVGSPDEAVVALGQGILSAEEVPVALRTLRDQLGPRANQRDELAPPSPPRDTNAAALVRGQAFIGRIAGLTAEQWVRGVLGTTVQDAARRERPLAATLTVMEQLAKSRDPILPGLRELDTAAVDLIARVLPVGEGSGELAVAARRALEQAVRSALIAVVLQDRLDGEDVALLLNPFRVNGSGVAED